jgi:hypothetical protein
MTMFILCKENRIKVQQMLMVPLKVELTCDFYFLLIFIHATSLFTFWLDFHGVFQNKIEGTMIP